MKLTASSMQNALCSWGLARFGVLVCCFWYVAYGGFNIVALSIQMRYLSNYHLSCVSRSVSINANIACWGVCLLNRLRNLHDNCITQHCHSSKVDGNWGTLSSDYHVVSLAWDKSRTNEVLCFIPLKACLEFSWSGETWRRLLDLLQIFVLVMIITRTKEYRRYRIDI